MAIPVTHPLFEQSSQRTADLGRTRSNRLRDRSSEVVHRAVLCVRYDAINKRAAGAAQWRVLLLVGGAQSLRIPDRLLLSSHSSSCTTGIVCSSLGGKRHSKYRSRRCRCSSRCRDSEEGVGDVATEATTSRVSYQAPPSNRPPPCVARTCRCCRCCRDQQHTKKCSTCMTALKRVKKALSAAKASTAVSLAWVRAYQTPWVVPGMEV